MMQKLARSQKAVEDYMQVQAHKNMLKTEMRKLQEEDMEKTHQRAKRLADKRKQEIMAREMNDKGTHDEVSKRTQKLVDFRYRNRVSFNVHHDKFN